MTTARVVGMALAEGLAEGLARTLREAFSDPKCSAVHLELTLENIADGEYPEDAFLELPRVLRGYELALTSDEGAVIAVFAYRDFESVDWLELARGVIEAIEEHFGSEVRSVRVSG
jgi:hypothetical protein